MINENKVIDCDECPFNLLENYDEICPDECPTKKEVLNLLKDMLEIYEDE